jgi:hypothetical protein
MLKSASRMRCVSSGYPRLLSVRASGQRRLSRDERMLHVRRCVRAIRKGGQSERLRLRVEALTARGLGIRPGRSAVTCALTRHIDRRRWGCRPPVVVALRSARQSLQRSSPNSRALRSHVVIRGRLRSRVSFRSINHGRTGADARDLETEGSDLTRNARLIELLAEQCEIGAARWWNRSNGRRVTCNSG